MSRRRVFLAYCSAKEDIATELKRGLEDYYEVALYGDWSGDLLLDKVLKEIELCQYGIAILSCDDKLQRNGEEKYDWVPRDNVILELGFFLKKFGKAKTVTVTVIEQNGDKPKTPTNIDGLLHCVVDTNRREATIEQVLNRIRRQFSEKGAQNIIPSLVPDSVNSESARGFNIITMDDARERWGSFEGVFYCLNPSWAMELSDPRWLRVHYERYQNPRFLEANYIVDIDRGRDVTACEAGSNSKLRVVEESRDLRGMILFLNKLLREYPSVEKELEDKLKVFVCPGVRSEMTTFVSECNNELRGFAIVRGLIPDDTVLEARTLDQVEVLRRRIYRLKAPIDHVSPRQLMILHSQIVGAAGRTV